MSKSRIDLISDAAAYYDEFFGKAEVVLPEKGYLPCPDFYRLNSGRKGIDSLHFSLNPYYFEAGYGRIAAEAKESAKNVTGKEEKAALNAVSKVFEKASEFIMAHAVSAENATKDAAGEEKERLLEIAHNCRAVAYDAPVTFPEALTLFWFTWKLRGIDDTSTIGRLDKYLIPFYRNSKKDGAEDSEILSLLVELWERINDIYSGDSLVNIMLGGSDEYGNDETNELSYLMLDAALTVRKSEPHINVRIHPKTPDDFIKKAARLQLLGHGQATVFSDELTIPSLISYGYDPKTAANYSNDGCVELTLDGGGLIDFFQMEAMKSLELALFNGDENVHFDSMEYYWTHTERKLRIFSSLHPGYRSGDFEKMTSYEEFYRAFFDQYTYQLYTRMDEMEENMSRYYAEQISSLFVEGLYPEFLESGIDLVHNPKVKWIRMVFLGSIPTVADSLAAIKKVVFEEKFCTPSELLDALRADWVGYETLRAKCKNAPKFGNDDDYVDKIAADLSNEICDLIAEYNKKHGTMILPALYDFLFSNHEKMVGATPDGRAWKDRICEHYSPTPGAAHLGPAKVINSSAKGPLARAVGTSPLYLTIPRSLAPENEKGLEIVESLVRAAIKKGICVFNLAIYDKEKLREAQKNPTGHEDIIVRVWGYCARFIDLSPDIQEHVIARVDGE